MLDPLPRAADDLVLHDRATVEADDRAVAAELIPLPHALNRRLAEERRS